jgi:O-antigen/teichoic acid export membrane protein
MRFGINRDTIKEIMGFSTQVGLADFFSKILSYSDKIAVSILGSITGLSFYYIAFQASSKILEIPSNVLTVYYSKFSKSYANNNIDLLKKDFKYATKVILIFISPLTLSLFCGSKFLLTLWLNKEVALISSPLLKIFCAGVFVGSISLPSINLANAIGKPKYPLQNNVLMGIILISISIVMIKTYGIIGGAIAWSSVQIIPLIFVTMRICKFLDINYKTYFLYDLLMPFIKISVIFLTTFVLFEFLMKNDILFLIISNLLSVPMIYFCIMNKTERYKLKEVISHVRN